VNGSASLRTIGIPSARCALKRMPTLTGSSRAEGLFTTNTSASGVREGLEVGVASTT
jgi:hypothetical protein